MGERVSYLLCRTYSRILYELFCVDYLQEKEKQQLIKAERAAKRLKKKAVEQHEQYKEAVTILKRYRTEAKKGRRLLKRHYVALIENAADVKDAGTYRPAHPLPPLTACRTYTYSLPTPTPAKKKLPALKHMFWSCPEMYEQYINQALSSDEDEDHGDNGDATDDHDHDQSVSENEWVPSSDDSPEPVSWGGRVGGWESHTHTPDTHSLTHTS